MRLRSLIATKIGVRYINAIMVTKLNHISLIEVLYLHVVKTKSHYNRIMIVHANVLIVADYTYNMKQCIFLCACFINLMHISLF